MSNASAYQCSCGNVAVSKQVNEGMCNRLKHT